MTPTISDKLRAKELRDEGQSYKRIAEELGVSATTVRRWTDEHFARYDRVYQMVWKQENGDRQREYDNRCRERRRRSHRCLGCRGPVYKDGATCEACRAESKRFRRFDIQRLWNEKGMTLEEIAAEVGTTRNYVWKEVQAMRREGWDIKRRIHTEVR